MDGRASALYSTRLISWKGDYTQMRVSIGYRGWEWRAGGTRWMVEAKSEASPVFYATASPGEELGINILILSKAPTCRVLGYSNAYVLASTLVIVCPFPLHAFLAAYLSSAQLGANLGYE